MMHWRLRPTGLRQASHRRTEPPNPTCKREDRDVCRPLMLRPRDCAAVEPGRLSSAVAVCNALQALVWSQTSGGTGRRAVTNFTKQGIATGRLAMLLSTARPWSQVLAADR